LLLVLVILMKMENGLKRHM